MYEWMNAIAAVEEDGTGYGAAPERGDGVEGVACDG